MAPLALSLLLLPLVAQGFAVPNVKKSQHYSLKKHRAKAFHKASPDRLTDNYLQLQNSEHVSRSSVFFTKVRNSKKTKHAKRQTAPIGNVLGQEYVVNVVLGGQNLSLILDTGSSDTWVIDSKFQCTDAGGNPRSQAACNFGKTYSGGLAELIPDQKFQISYGDGEFVSGNMGYQSVSLAGINVERQQIAVGTSAYWNGDAVTAGLIGLAYSAITSSYKTSDGSRVPYDPIFTTMYKNNLTAPSFAIALQRGSGGYISFGGLPPVSYSNNFASAPIQVLNGQVGNAGNGLSFYTITPDAVVYSGSSSSQSAQYIVDSGTTLLYAPSSVASAVGKLFSPPATVTNGQILVNCDAKAPSVAYKIGGQEFTINAKDLVFNAGNNQCLSGIQDGGSGPYILGDVFMNNVLAVFDVGAAQMRFSITTY